MEIFKGRFGNFYLYKIWAFTVVVGAIFFAIIYMPLEIDTEYILGLFQYILVYITFGAMLCIPSLILSEISYKILSKLKLSNHKVLISTIIFSLITTNMTYRYFLAEMANVEFFISYNFCLIVGFFIFKRTPKTLNFKP